MTSLILLLLFALIIFLIAWKVIDYMPADLQRALRVVALALLLVWLLVELYPRVM